jgi:OmpA-OmpF porin, OOP family
MAIDLIDLAKRQLTPEVVDKLSAYTGESGPATSKALSGSVPTMLAGLLSSASAPGGLTRLIDLFGQGRHDGSILSAIPAQLSGSGLDGLISSGSSILGSLFGTRQDAVTGVIASSSAVRQSSAGSLLSVAAPMVLGLIGRQLSSTGGVTMSSLKDLLLGQRSAIVANAPPGLANALGLHDLGSLGTNLAEAPAVPQPAVEKPRSRSWMPLVIGVAAVVVLFLLIPLLRGPGRRAAVSMDTLSTAAQPMSTPSSGSLTDLLSTKLGLSSRQANGGLGSILTYAQNKLSADDYGQVAATIPGASDAIQLAKDAGAVTGPITDLKALQSAYGHLGISPEVGQKLNSSVVDYASKAGGPQVGRILGNLLK